MGNNHIITLALFFIFVNVLVTGQQNKIDGVIITPSDFQALQAFKRELIDARGVLRSWNGTRNAACSGSWAGIKCIKGHVVAIQLPFKALAGRISDKVGQFKELRKFSLHDNLITGTIPSSLGSLPNLRGLYLFNNRLSGSIPPSIGNSPQLQAIDLSNNLLNGFIPPKIISSPRIYRLNLSFNSLSGSIPSSFSESSSVAFVALQFNNLTGSIPTSWENKGGYQLRSLTLDHNSISGTIPKSLGKLGNLEELSLSHNKINGTIPNELSSLEKLRVLDLSDNVISGTVPKELGGLKNVSVINLEKNKLTGHIPPTIGNLSSINALDLSENNFTGEIPVSFENLSKLTSFNVSNNDLSGQVPARLSKRFNSSSFSGNLQLCGFSASTPCFAQAPISESPSSSPNPSKRRRLSTKDIILIIVGALLAVLFVLCCVLLCCLIRKRTGSKASNGKNIGHGGEKGVVLAGEASEGGPTGGKLVLFDGPFVFTADDLLCATAEIMGKSPYGTVYKATLEDGNQVAVKRLREKLAKAPKEFEIEVGALGRIRHPNLLPLRAYYLGPKGEKLLVFDYLTKGSLSSFLHARGPEITIDWPTRMKIALGVTRGLNHLHNQENLVHGNLASSDVYLDEQNKPKVSDYGIHRLMTDTANTNVSATAGATGYRAPELPKTKKSSTKTDIYSLGVILLELLTGKSPSETIEGSDLPQWVASTVKEEWTNEVFDLELMRDVSTTGDEMLNTLKLALHLVDPSPEARPDIQQVLQQLEEINPKLAAETAADSAEKGHH
ncbi:probably inactive leucine-rich repeat receptor-like protein kinase IMK2 [Silene latifolia]|uniref:probably inactive leucine-rich repeat receptor-like protein kinase IMK2 n=1 Tax=Silene latifolia TaxID=37657 RepID=UPI003D76F1E5